MKDYFNTKFKIIIEEFLRDFNPKNLKTKLRIEDSSENEEEPVKKQKKKQKNKLIIESSSSVTEDTNSSQEIKIKKGKTRKTKLVGIKPKTKKNK